jgi:hypothetical protein
MSIEKVLSLCLFFENGELLLSCSPLGDFTGESLSTEDFIFSCYNRMNSAGSGAS